MGVGNHVFTIVWSAGLVIHLDSTAVMSSCIFAFAFANRRNLASDLMLPIAARRYSFYLATAAISPNSVQLLTATKLLTTEGDCPIVRGSAWQRIQLPKGCGTCTRQYLSDY